MVPGVPELVEELVDDVDDVDDDDDFSLLLLTDDVLEVVGDVLDVDGVDDVVDGVDVEEEELVEVLVELDVEEEVEVLEDVEVVEDGVEEVEDVEEEVDVCCLLCPELLFMVVTPGMFIVEKFLPTVVRSVKPCSMYGDMDTLVGVEVVKVLGVEGEGFILSAYSSNKSLYSSSDSSSSFCLFLN